MKKISTLMAITMFFVMLLSYNGNAQNNKQPKASASVNKIEVIDFHSTHRCITCKSIEANTKYTLETFFAKELKNGKITFQSINVDKKENYKIAYKFKASGTSLFLNVIINSKETIINLTKLAFTKGRDQTVFSKVLKNEIDKQKKKFKD